MKTIKFTEGQLLALSRALGKTLDCADNEEQRTIFGSTQGAMAAARAQSKIDGAINWAALIRRRR